MEHTVHPAWNRDNVNEAQQKEAIAKIDELITLAAQGFEAAIKEAQALADKFDINIYLAPTGYGSGSTYNPKLPEDWDSSSCSGEDESAGKWVSSSQNC